jgi:hypothetical protein
MRLQNTRAPNRDRPPTFCRWWQLALPLASACRAAVTSLTTAAESAPGRRGTVTRRAEPSGESPSCGLTGGLCAGAWGALKRGGEVEERAGERVAAGEEEEGGGGV